MSVPGDAQGGIDSASHSSITPNMGATSVTQDYTGYSTYSGNTTTPYSYAGSEYQNYYYGYQQPANVISQQVGTNQITGAAYQPLSSFQNSGSYVNPSSYFGSYSNTGDNQTTAGYGQSNYSYQNNSWNDANVGNYGAHQYPNYGGQDANSTPNSNSNAISTNSHHYQQPYNQWSYYYGQSAPVAAGATGTDHSSAPSVPSAAYSSAGVGYPYVSPQPPPPGTTPWRNDPAPPSYSTFQEREALTSYPSNTSWQTGAPATQTNHINQPTYFQVPLNSNPPPDNHNYEQKVLSSQVSTLQHSSSNQVVENLQPPLHTVPMTDVRQASKVQIPVNPRIAPNLVVGAVKTLKESPTHNATAKPAYLSVPAPKLANKLSSQDDAQATTKGMLPASLRAYVERTFARCKDDAQRAANQNIMREIISKATTDGTLISKNWDTEPLFPLPNNSSDTLEQSKMQSFASVSSLSKNRRSPGRRTKSRWEPVAEDKTADIPDSSKDFNRAQAETSEKQGSGRSYENDTNGWNRLKYFSPQQQATLQKYIQRPTKRPRPSHTSNVTDSGDASSDSDKEQGLTKYYASAIAIADSPEEKRRREHRYKRFEGGQGSQVQAEYIRPKNASSGNTYTRRSSAMLLSRHYDDGSGVAVEDIDWDSLTVKGTCQEVEKRYLRLTSAPDPATVRPEDVLEKALKMVELSPKNYLYKCDQLKSIRQDLTVQRIQNALTVKVYETHARLALEAGDLPEYNQCQSQLKRLYGEGIEGCHLEFSAYNLLCIILHSNNKRELLSSMSRLSDEAKKNEAVKHALAVRSAVSSGNYVLFFRLYKAAPNLNMCLMDLYLEKMRFEAVKCMSKSYRPVVPVVYIAEILGFSKCLQTEECEEWLRAHGAILTIDSSGELQLDTKASSSSLYMPEPDDAVAHGDANLAVDDFLARAS